MEVCKRLPIFKINSVYKGVYISEFNGAIIQCSGSSLQNISETENRDVIFRKSFMLRSDIRFFGNEKWTMFTYGQLFPNFLM